MLALHLVLFWCTGIYGQSAVFNYSTNDEYAKLGMTQIKIPNIARFSNGATSGGDNDPNIIVTADCIAANNYGQWTYTSNPGSNVVKSGHAWLFSPDQINSSWAPATNDKAWILLGNMMAVPSEQYVSSDASHHPGCQPPGVVSGGLFTNSVAPSATTPPQVTCNYVGQVRYIWVNSFSATPRNEFIIQGLNDERGATTAERQIDITLNGLPNPPINRQIVKSHIFSYTSASCGGKTVTTDETYHADEMNTVSDQEFTYIVWCYFNSGHHEIWATAIPIDGGSPPTGFPLKVSSGTTDCVRPTVSCDPDNAPGSPTFLVAYIHVTAGSIPSSITGSEVIVKTFTGTSSSTTTLAKQYADPWTGVTVGYNFVTHAKVLRSVGGSTDGIYVLMNDGLIYYDLSTGNAEYVDGIVANRTGHDTPLPTPLVGSSCNVNNSSTPSGILDKPIVAFVNPYGNLGFHCMYQLAVTSPSKNPLIVIRNWDNGYDVDGSGNDTRVLLNKEIISSAVTVVDNPDSYCGAANQMGIHMHWYANDSHNSNITTHYYVRDRRAFVDEIDENTLITNECYIEDGTSGGGSTTVQVADEVNVTIWTDPNYGAQVGGMYLNHSQTTSSATGYFYDLNIGALKFQSTGLSLDFSDGYTYGNFYTMPVCNIAKTGYDGTININSGATWDYYGSPNWADWNNAPSTGHAGITLNLVGSADYPSTLNIHGGAIFWECPLFNASYARIDIRFEANTSPINTSANASATGLFKVSSVATINLSKVNSFLPYSTWYDENDIDPTDKMSNVIMHITWFNAANDPSIFTLNSLNTDYSNFASLTTMDSPGGGIGMILYDGPDGTTHYNGCGSYFTDPGLDEVVFDGGSFNQMRFRAINPGVAGLEITNNTIDFIDQDVIHIQNPLSDYAGIIVSNNTFLHVLPNFGSGVVNPYDPDYGIVIEGFNNSDFFNEVNVNNNLFTSTLNNSSGYWMEGAIKFINTTGNIEINQVTNTAYGNGITITSNGGSAISHAYLCSNTLSNLTNFGGQGIISDHYKGYVNGCQISGCTYGYESGDFDNPMLINTSITGCEIGIDISGGSHHYSEVDLTGFHFDYPTNDASGFNRISGNATVYSGDAEVVFSDITHSSIINYGDLSVGTWSNWGQNNTSSTVSSLTTRLIGGIASIGSIKGNYWTGGNSPSANIAGGITYTPFPLITGDWIPGSTPPTIPSVTCGAVYPAKAKGIDKNPMSVTSDYDTCAHLKAWEHVDPPYTDTIKQRQKYDSLRYYIEKCAAHDNNSYTAFSHLDGTVQLMSKDTNRYDVYRNWLISVLYLNSLSAYFCNCIGSIAGTYQYGKYKNGIGDLAILNYLRKSNHGCWVPSRDDPQYAKDSTNLARKGYDAINLPTLDSLGLGIILQHDANAVVPSPILLSTIYLALFTSNPNPFNKETTLEFTLNRMAYTTVAVYDELGRLVWGDGRGSSLEAGMHQIHLDGKDLPHGTLYARISTGFGEVKTVKLIHE
jgi:hypothetical protein